MPTTKKKPPSGKAIKIPDDLYEALQALQGVYPSLTLMEIAALKLRKGLEDDREALTQLRALQERAAKK